MEFLRARLDEDEAAAKRAAAIALRWVDAGSLLLGLTEEPETYDLDFAEATNYRYDDALTHAARHDPARVLADVEAKRRMLDDLYPSVKASGETIQSEWGSNPWDCDKLLALLALPYADHPDYRPEWKP